MSDSCRQYASLHTSHAFTSSRNKYRPQPIYRHSLLRHAESASSGHAVSPRNTAHQVLSFISSGLSLISAFAFELQLQYFSCRIMNTSHCISFSVSRQFLRFEASGIMSHRRFIVNTTMSLLHYWGLLNIYRVKKNNRGQFLDCLSASITEGFISSRSFFITQTERLSQPPSIRHATGFFNTPIAWPPSIAISRHFSFQPLPPLRRHRLSY
jgi:hypothetical protein